MPPRRRLDVDVITLFPEPVEAWRRTSLIDIAVRMGATRIRCINPRDFTSDRHRTVDDRPYGGGPGMVMQCGPLFDAVESIGLGPAERGEDELLILLTPAGATFNQRMARRFGGLRRIGLICGRYEGIDERVVEGLRPLELSIGDYVLNGGEVAAMAVAESVIRLLPDVLGKAQSHEAESFEAGLLDYPQYTRPEDYRGMRVPEVLLSGDHEAIRAWRHERALQRTRQRRRDLLDE